MPNQLGNMPQGMMFGAANMGGSPAGQNNVRQLQMQLAQAQAYGANPAMLAQLQLQLQNAMQDAQRAQQMDYINRVRSSGAGPIGRAGGYGAQADPWLMGLFGAQSGGGNNVIG